MNSWVALSVLVTGINLFLTSIIFYYKFKTKDLTLLDKNEWIRGIISGIFLISLSVIFLFLFRVYPYRGFLLKIDWIVIAAFYALSIVLVYSGKKTFRTPDFFADNMTYSRYIGIGNIISGIFVFIFSTLSTIINVFF